MSRSVEEPCSETGGPCEWLSDEWGDAGEFWDLYCCRCLRSRDWTKDVLEEPRGSSGTSALLAAFDRGELSERAVLFLLAMLVLDFWEAYWKGPGR